ncbi:MAG: tetratricopeptide repeat protein [Campylobacterota bacterium]|nr:tetratricopeptide repeat protein [Campylobacterota bacterium]
MKRVILLSAIVGTLLWSETVQDKFGQHVVTTFELDLQKAKTLRLPYNPEYNPTSSIEMLLKLVKQKPDYYRGHYNLGLAYFVNDEYEKSKASFDKAIKIRTKQNIKDATIFNSAGWSAMKAQDYKRAERLFLQGVANKTLNSKSSNASLFGNLGQLYFYTQRFDKALKYLNIAKDQYGSQSVQVTIDSIKEIQKKVQLKRAKSKATPTI